MKLVVIKVETFFSKTYFRLDTNFSSEYDLNEFIFLEKEKDMVKKHAIHVIREIIANKI